MCILCFHPVNSDPIVWPVVILYNTVQWGTIKYSTVQYTCSTVHYAIVLCTVQYWGYCIVTNHDGVYHLHRLIYSTLRSSVLYFEVQYCTIKYSTVQYHIMMGVYPVTFEQVLC